MIRYVLVLNAGSTSLKYAVFQNEDRLHAGLAQSIAEALSKAGAVDAVGHRFVHGGTRYRQPVLLTAGILADLEELVPLAPLHQPVALAAVREVERAFPGRPQVACFDTAFHASLPELEARFPLPRELYDRGIRRYGFHGSAFESAALQLQDSIHLKLVIAHLGGGSSVCGMVDGRSQYTSMGLTPLDGPLMATRSGRIDPGVLLYLLRDGLNSAELEEMLERRSGLLGLSGISADVRDLQSSNDPRAAFALEAFARSVAREIAAAAVAIGGIELLAFSGGIGENSAAVRGRICELLAWAGVRVDAAANAGNATPFHTPSSAVQLQTIRVDEEAVVAARTLKVLEGIAP
jgi:acetate kinase